MITNPIDKLVTEWAYRCKKGYPDINNLEDRKVLEEIMSELGILNELTNIPKGATFNYNGEKWTVTQDSYGGTVQAKRGKNVETFKLADLDTAITNPVKPQSTRVSTQTVDSVLKAAGVSESTIEKVKSSNLYQKALSIEDFAKNVDEYNTAFYEDLFNYKIPGGGRGELIPFVAIKGAKLGGLNEKDITLNGKVLEVKDLVKTRIFQTATGGSVAGTDFTKNIETFFKYLEQFDVSRVHRSTIEYYNENYGKGGFKTSELKKLAPIAKSLKNEVKDYKYIKVGNERYALDPGQKYSVELDSEGRLVTDIPTADEIKVVEAKLLRHPWVTSDGEQIAKDLEKIKTVYLDQVDYILLYRNGEPLVLTKEAAKSRLAPYRISKGQLQLELLDS